MHECVEWILNSYLNQSSTYCQTWFEVGFQSWKIYLFGVLPLLVWTGARDYKACPQQEAQNCIAITCIDGCGSSNLTRSVALWDYSINLYHKINSPTHANTYLCTYVNRLLASVVVPLWLVLLCSILLFLFLFKCIYNSIANFLA